MKINEKNLLVFATSSKEVGEREGFLSKRAEGGRGGFNKRWFVLKGNLLFYFEKKGDREPIGLVILEGSTVELAETELEEQFCFKISFPSKEYILAADSQTSMEQWMKALACANYEYVKLLAAELQRQLDEICNEPVESSSDWDRVGHRKGLVGTPTPPPRLRTASRQAGVVTVSHQQQQGGAVQVIRHQQQQRTFPSIHAEYGAKILHHQRERWSAMEGTPKGPTPLSLTQNKGLINL